MIAWALRTQSRIERFAGDLKNLGWTAVEVAILRMSRRLRVPAFPLRCRHCGHSIRLATVAHPALHGGARPRVIYGDASGAFYCYRGIPHQPMPSIR